jgi:hypothetical protein
VVHLKRASDLLLEAAVQGLALAVGHRVEDHPHEQPPLAARVLVGVDDVEPGVGEEAADRRDQAGPVRAGEEKARCGLLGDPPMMAVCSPFAPSRTQECPRKIGFRAKWRMPLRA